MNKKLTDSAGTNIAGQNLPSGQKFPTHFSNAGIRADAFELIIPGKCGGKGVFATSADEKLTPLMLAGSE